MNGGARGGLVASSVGQGQVMMGGQGMVLVSQASGQAGTNSSTGGVIQPGGKQVQEQVMVPGQRQGQAMLVQQPGGQKHLLFIQPEAGDNNIGKHVVGQQIVRQVMAGQPGGAVNREGNLETHLDESSSSFSLVKTRLTVGKNDRSTTDLFTTTSLKDQDDFEEDVSEVNISSNVQEIEALVYVEEVEPSRFENVQLPGIVNTRKYKCLICYACRCRLYQ